MNEQPIIFSAEMVRAILAGPKTQTRRVIKPQTEDYMREAAMAPGSGALWNNWAIKVGGKIKQIKCPYGKVGDLLWVRETWGAWPHMGGGVQADSLRYRATDDKPNDPHNTWRWRPSIYMPKHVARIWLEITNVRVERVQDISEPDSQAEGCDADYVTGQTYRFNFSYLWDSINRERGYGWEVNPWVWVLEFRKVER